MLEECIVDVEGFGHDFGGMIVFLKESCCVIGVDEGKVDFVILFAEGVELIYCFGESEKLVDSFDVYLFLNVGNDEVAVFLIILHL